MRPRAIKSTVDWRTDKADDEPALIQDLDNTTERAGRARDKEDLMERLRNLGYM